MKWLLVIFLLGVTAMAQEPQEMMPFSIQNPDVMPFSIKMATAFYWGASREVARELGKKELVPSVILRFDKKAERPSTVTFRNGTTLIVLKDWNPTAFAQACVWAANYAALLDKDAVIAITNRVIREYNATASVTDLKKAK